MLRLAVQPPTQARAGVALWPPVAARLRSETSIFEELSQLWAVATLVHESGEVLYDQLGGRVADSAHPLPQSTADGSSSSISASDKAYFYFPDLVVPEPGRYCIRVSLMQMDYSSDETPEGVVVVREYKDSRWLDVESSTVATSTPSSDERRFLKKLKNDGQHVPPAPE